LLRVLKQLKQSLSSLDKSMSASLCQSLSTLLLAVTGDTDDTNEAKAAIVTAVAGGGAGGGSIGRTSVNEQARRARAALDDELSSIMYLSLFKREPQRIISAEKFVRQHDPQRTILAPADLVNPLAIAGGVITAGDTSTTSVAAAALSESSVISGPMELLESLLGGVDHLLYELMLAPMRAKLNGFADWKIWSQSSPSTQAHLPLPMFSVQPSEYMTQIAEQLLAMLPQLETFMARTHVNDGTGNDNNGSSSSSRNDDSGDDTKSHESGVNVTTDDKSAQYWVNKVAIGVVKLLLERIAAIPKLSDRGCRQLATDIDYLANVLSGILIPPHRLVSLTHCCC
jgi:hypothetical protein